jgi:hypothetical protein
MEILKMREEISLLTKNLPSSYKKYYHLKSIENFLYNFDKLSDEESKQYVKDLLAECIDYYQCHSISNVFESLDIFQKYLKPVGQVYERQLNFSITIKPWLFTLYVLIGFLFVYLVFDNNPVAIIIFLLIMLSFVIYFGLKFSKHKLYAFLW